MMATSLGQHEGLLSSTSVQEREDIIHALLASLPRSRLAGIQQKLTPMLLLDVVGLLPDEVALQIFSHLTWQELLICASVSRRWYAMASDPALWRAQCTAQRWAWRDSPQPPLSSAPPSAHPGLEEDDEGMGADEELPRLSDTLASVSLTPPPLSPRADTQTRDYKLLHQTHVRLRDRVRRGSYALSFLQARNAPPGARVHTNTIYCLMLYTCPQTGEQVLLTGSKDRSVREWDLKARKVRRVLEQVHAGSVLSLCAKDGWAASGGSDRTVVVYEMNGGKVIGRRRDHEDSVLCVRFDDRRLVTCSKDGTIWTYNFPALEPLHHLRGHRAAVNAVALDGKHIVSASGDRSVRLWDADSGTLLHTFDNHHTRGIASIDVTLPLVVTGSSDKHLRLLDLSTSTGWCTDPLAGPPARPLPAALRPGFPSEPTPPMLMPPQAPCSTCGSCPPTPASAGASAATGMPKPIRRPRAHAELVRSVALGGEWVVSASYDHTIKVWDRRTGAILVDLAGGHTGRIFCVDFDATKIVSCGEDQKICIWDFSHGIDTSFLAL